MDSFSPNPRNGDTDVVASARVIFRLLLKRGALAENFTSTRRGRDDCGRRLRLQHILLAPESGYVVLKVTNGGVASGLARHLTPDAAVD